MKGYNLYYKSTKLNKNALSEKEMNDIMNSAKKIYKKNNITNQMDEINPNDIICIKTIVI